MTGFHRYTLYVTACCILAVTPALADKEIDMALAEALISEIKRQIEVDKRAHERAVNALAETEEGKERMKTCRNRNTSYRAACLHGKDWNFKGAYQPHCDQFHSEETATVVAEGLEAMQDGGSDQ